MYRQTLGRPARYCHRSIGERRLPQALPEASPLAFHRFLGRVQPQAAQHHSHFRLVHLPVDLISQAHHLHFQVQASVVPELASVGVLTALAAASELALVLAALLVLMVALAVLAALLGQQAASLARHRQAF